MSGQVPEILAQSADWVVLNKPPGWLTIPGRSGARAVSGILLPWVEERFGRTWVVHRIDVETSGVILFARTAEAHRKASLWFQRHEVRKTYDFLGAGSPHAPMARIQEPIEGSPSITQMEVKERYPGAFLGQARPL